MLLRTNYLEAIPAAVIPLENWIADDLMQKLALENNLSETVFLFRQAKTTISAGSLLPLK